MSRMKRIIIFLSLFFCFLSFSSANAGFLDDFINDSQPNAYICSDGEC